MRARFRYLYLKYVLPAGPIYIHVDFFNLPCMIVWCNSARASVPQIFVNFVRHPHQYFCCGSDVIFNPHGKMASEDERRQKSLEEYRRRLIEHRELDAKLKKSKDSLLCVREMGREEPVVSEHSSVTLLKSPSPLPPSHIPPLPSPLPPPPSPSHPHTFPCSA